MPKRKAPASLLSAIALERSRQAEERAKARRRAERERKFAEDLANELRRAEERRRAAAEFRASGPVAPRIMDVPIRTGGVLRYRISEQERAKRRAMDRGGRRRR